ncbi:MAG: CHASE3 domain-containing protein [Verrucomicrobiae bacterium]|nr:CHASE3 domain-containing protein [Verrucomicrobiae bacterium]
MIFSIRNKLLLGFAASALALLGVGWLSLRTTNELINATESVIQTHKVIATLADGLAVLTEAETAQRGFLLTGEETFLADCRSAEAEAGKWVVTLLGLVADNPAQHRRGQELAALIKQRLAILNQRISVRQREGLDQAAAAVAQREGKTAMDQCRALMAQMQAEEARLLAERQAASRASTRRSLGVIVASSILACALGVLAILVIQRDLLRREAAERQLQESARQIQDLYNLAPCGYHSLDANGVFLAVNDTELTWLGYTREELVGRRSFADLLTPASARVFIENFPRFKARGSVKDLEFEMVRKDGSLLPVLLNATAIRDDAGGYVASRSTVFDISSRKRAEEERDRIFNLSRDLMCIAGFDGRFRTVNPAWQETLGFPAAEFTNRPFLDFVHPDDRAATVAETEKLAGGGETVHFENRYRGKDGAYRWLAWAARASVPQQLIYATARDITGIKRAQEEINRLHADLQQRAALLETANRELEAFSYSVSHDLRAPLRHIDGFVDLLDRKCGAQLDEGGRRYLRIIAEAARQMGTLIDDLLVFSRMGRAELRWQEVDLKSLVHEAVAGLETELDGREVEWRVGTLPRVRGDAAMLRQVLVNLIGNAIKYTRPRNPARIEIGCAEETTTEQVFFVRDNGVGFDMQYVGKLFGVFQRLHHADEFEGTGIGLANVRRIIHRHGGRTWAEGKLDSGATLFFTLPRSQ